MKNTGAIFKALKLAPSTAVLFGFSFLLSLISFSQILYPRLYGWFFDAISTKDPVYLHYLTIILGYYAAYFILENLCYLCFIKYKIRVGFELNLFFSKKIIDMDELHLGEKGEGYFTSLVQESITNLVYILSPEAMSSILLFIQALGILYFIYVLSPVSALVITIWVVFQLAWLPVKQKLYEKTFSEMLEANNQHNALAVRRFTQSDLPCTYAGIAKSFVQDIAESTEKLVRKETRHEVFSSVIAPFISVHIEPLMRVGLYFIAAGQYFSGHLSLGGLASIFAYLVILSNNIGAFTTIIHAYISAKVSATELNNFLEECSAPVRTFGVSEHFVELKDFLFRLQQDSRPTNKINATLPKREIYSLTGENGLGKSTFVKILLGRCERYSGTVLCPRQINYIPQDCLIIDDYSVKNNITMCSKMDAECFKRIVAELDIAYLLHRTNLENLSSGEKRKIVLGRFLYHLHDNFILDEVFVSLDKEFLSYILPIIKRHIDGKSGIVISHNPVVIRQLCSSDALDRLLDQECGK